MIKIPDWHKDHTTQSYKIRGKEWSIARLVELSKSLEVFDADIRSICIDYTMDWTMLDAVMHIKAVINADMQYPIILSDEGIIMDGRHRLMKAILNGHDTIKAVRFDQNPQPCQITEE